MRPVTTTATFLALTPYVRAMSHRLGDGAVEPEDLAQVGMLAMTVAQRQFDASRGVAIEAYIKGRVRATMIDEIRRHAGRRGWLHRRRELAAAAELCPAAYQCDPESPYEEYARREIRDHLRAAIAALPARERQVITLRYGGDEATMKIADVAAALGVSESLAWKLRQRAVDRLRRYLRIRPRGLPR